MVTTATVSLLEAIALELDLRITATCSCVMILDLGGKE